MRIWRSMAVVVLAGGLVLGACSSDDGDGGGGGGAYGDDTTTTAKQEPAAEQVTVQVGDTELGEVLTDASGMTLYLYASDEGTTSKVPDAVLDAWPPIEATGTPTAGEGLDAAKLTTATQANGQDWVAYNGHLLYRFTGDQAPGDVAGQGLGGVWFVLSSTGEKISS